MRRISRLESSISLIRTRSSVQSSSIYLCSTCRNRAAPFSTSSLWSRPAKPFTEKIRSRIWGTEDPPGQEDPYGDKSVFDKTKQRQKEEELKEARELAELEREQREQELEEERAQKGKLRVAYDLSTYTAADTWDGSGDGSLQWVGEEEHWWEGGWENEHQYAQFVPKVDKIMRDPDQITAAFYRTLVEIHACKEAGLALTSSSASTHWDPSDRTQIHPTESGVDLVFTEGNTLEALTQSLQEPVDETAEHENPTGAEEEVAADRSEVDPLQPDSIPESTEETFELENPTESEENLAADAASKFEASSDRDVAYENFVKSLGTSWHQIPLTDPEIKFAVSIALVILYSTKIDISHRLLNVYCA